MRGMWRTSWRWGRRGLSSGILDANFGGGTITRCNDGDGDEVTITFHSLSGQQYNWLGQGTFRTYAFYTSLICNGTAWTVDIIFPDYPTVGAYMSFGPGTLTETSPGVWTFLITGINLGDTCVYQLGGSWNEADCA